MKSKLNKTSIYLLLILSFALVLRLFRIENLSLFGDELDVGYHAYSLLKTGRDYLDQLLPTYIHSLSEWRAPLLMYSSIPFIKIFGLNTLGLRLTPVFFGILSIYLLFHLVRFLTKNNRLALLSAFVLALTPWHIHYSRAAFEVTLLLTLLLSGTLFFLKKKNYLSFFLFSLTFYTYSTANIFTPLLVLFLILSTVKKPKDAIKTYLKPTLLAFLICLPILLTILKGQASERFGLISIFSDSQTIHTIVNKRNTGLGPSTERFFYNKAVFWTKDFLKNYSSSFSPEFLFSAGDANPRHSVPGFGQLTWIMAPFLLLGAFQLLKSKSHSWKLKSLTFAWLLVAPLPSALTIGGGTHATRLFLLLPPLCILTAFGIEFLLKSLKKVYLPLLLFSLMTLATGFWFYEYLVHYPQEQFKLWHYGYQEAFEYLQPIENDYQRILINNTYQPALVPYLFWTQTDPEWFHNNFTTDQISPQILPGFDGYKIGDSLYFGAISTDQKISWLTENLKPTDLYLAFQLHEAPGDWNWEKEPPAGLKILKTVYNPLNEPLIYWITREE